MKMLRIKSIVIAVFAMAFAALLFLQDSPQVVSAAADDPAAIYKTKCAMCHKPDASKAFDPTKPEADLVNAILNGVPTAKPPMPEYKTKGITEETAKALVTHMKSLRPAAQ